MAEAVDYQNAMIEAAQVLVEDFGWTKDQVIDEIESVLE